jgi:hypothetical protein
MFLTIRLKKNVRHKFSWQLAFILLSLIQNLVDHFEGTVQAESKVGLQKISYDAYYALIPPYLTFT